MTFWKRKTEEEQPSASSSTSASHTVAPQASARPASQSPASSPEVELSALNAQDHLTQKYGKVRSALGPGTIIQGKLSFDTPVRIDGKLSGEVYSSKALIVGPTGQIDANIDAACLIIFGQVKGNVKASEKIELYSGGQLEGKIQTPAISIESGAHFNGNCDMGLKSKVASVEGKRQDTASTKIITNESVDLGGVLGKAASVTADSGKPQPKDEKGASGRQASGSLQ